MERAKDRPSAQADTTSCSDANTPVQIRFLRHWQGRGTCGLSRVFPPSFPQSLSPKPFNRLGKPFSGFVARQILEHWVRLGCARHPARTFARGKIHQYFVPISRVQHWFLVPFEALTLRARVEYHVQVEDVDSFPYFPAKGATLELVDLDWFSWLLLVPGVSALRHLLRTLIVGLGSCAWSFRRREGEHRANSGASSVHPGNLRGIFKCFKF